MHFGSQDEEQTMKRYIVSLLVQQAQSDQQFEPIEKNTWLMLEMHSV